MSAYHLLNLPRLLMLFRADVYNVRRDPIMALALGAIMLLPAALWYWREPLDAYALSAFEISGFSDYVVSFVLIIPSILLGWVTGMLLLEDRDDGPLLALEVTPVGRNGFLLYRAGATALLSFIVTLIITGMLMDEPLSMKLYLALLIALEAVMFTFALLSMAGNKVEGLALSKVLNIAALIPLAALITSPLRYLAAVIPSYWVGELLYIDTLPKVLAYPLAILVHLAVLICLYRLMLKRIG